MTQVREEANFTLKHFAAVRQTFSALVPKYVRDLCSHFMAVTDF
jgi:hypothetical protein